MNQTRTVNLDPEFVAHVTTRTPMPFSHRLPKNQLLGIDAIADLAEELGPRFISAQEATKPLVAASTSFRDMATGGIASAIRELAVNDSWFTLLNIERSSIYRGLIDEILDSIAAAAGVAPQWMRRRMGFVFASSPGAITPAHFDIEHSLLFQLAGHRTLTFGDWPSQADRDAELRRYWDEQSFGRLERMPYERTHLALEPGIGCYIPPYVPHWLTNQDAPSLSLTLTFFEPTNDRQALVESFNSRARRLGLRRTRRYGEAPGRDRGKAGVMRIGNRLKCLVSRGGSVGVG